MFGAVFRNRWSGQAFILSNRHKFCQRYVPGFIQTPVNIKHATLDVEVDASLHTSALSHSWALCVFTVESASNWLGLCANRTEMAKTLDGESAHSTFNHRQKLLLFVHVPVSKWYVAHGSRQSLYDKRYCQQIQKNGWI